MLTRHASTRRGTRCVSADLAPATTIDSTPMTHPAMSQSPLQPARGRGPRPGRSVPDEPNQKATYLLHSLQKKEEKSKPAAISNAAGKHDKTKTTKQNLANNPAAIRRTDVRSAPRLYPGCCCRLDERAACRLKPNR